MAFIPKYILILLMTIVVDYFAGIWIERSSGKKRGLYLIVSVVMTCLILFFFKYFDFFALNVTELAKVIGWNYSIEPLKLILPLGLSFHTFQSLSYVIEVYRGNQKAEQHFGIYALYVMFFPQLVAGPIERPQNLLHQFHDVQQQKHKTDYSMLASGAKLVAWGLFKKVAVADRLSAFVDPVYHDVAGADVLHTVIAFFCFYFQIYADFSGYSDIARGTARLLGIELMQNFNLPYMSKSLTEFWKRWHISLSTWLRDYVYEPLAIDWRALGYTGVCLALMVTFFISGFWHGAKWTFVIWGVFHGIVLSMEVILGRFFKTKHRIFAEPVSAAIGITRTFLLICASYVFFRAATFDDAIGVFLKLRSAIAQLPSIGYYLLPENLMAAAFWTQPWQDLRYAVLMVMTMVSVEWCASRGWLQMTLQRASAPVRIMAYQVFVLLLIVSGAWFGAANQFIYFQF